MNDTTWERIVDAIDATTGLDRHGKEEQPVPDQPRLTQNMEFFEFTRGGQEFRLERVSGPAIVDRKTHYSHKPGAANRMEYIYDENEIANKVTLFKKINDDWQEVELNQLGL